MESAIGEEGYGQERKNNRIFKQWFESDTGISYLDDNAVSSFQAGGTMRAKGPALMVLCWLVFSEHWTSNRVNEDERIRRWCQRSRGANHRTLVVLQGICFSLWLILKTVFEGFEFRSVICTDLSFKGIAVSMLRIDSGGVD